MRIIGKLSDVAQVKQLSASLNRLKIDHTVDGTSIWVHNEDRIEEASALFSQFQENPNDPKFAVSAKDLNPEPELPFELREDVEVIQAVPPKKFGRISSVLIALCCLVFFLSALQQLAYVEKGVPESVYLVTPIQSALYIDVPAPVEHLEIELQKYAPPEGQAPRLPQSLITEIQAVGQAPFWRGYAQMLDIKMKGGDPSIADGPMFTKVKEGEFWRLITPIFLHGSILHILFNMLWLWVLGKQIEEKVGAIRYLILTLAIGVFANVVQYLATGPFFLGYSGVVMGLAGFIWSRERIAKWEGYPLRQSMILFLALFVVALTGLELISFGLVYFGINSFEPNIANSAHIGGAVIGALLGRLPFFAARPNL